MAGLIKNNLVIELHVPDFSLVREFYSKLGFRELLYDPTSGGNSDLGYLTMYREDPAGRTMLNFYGDRDRVTEHAHFANYPTNTPRGYGVELTVVVDDVDYFWDSVENKISSENISQSLTRKRWGQKDFRLIDPFGFYIRFTELVDWGQS